MTKLKRQLTSQDICPGRALCDMHYGLRDLCFEAEVKSHIQVTLPGASGLLQKCLTALGGRPSPVYTNKMLVVLERGIGPVQPGYVLLKCAYSYDNRYFGLVELLAPDPEA